MNICQLSYLFFLQSIICVDTLDLEDNWLRNVGCKQLCKMLLENDNIHDMVRRQYDIVGVVLQ